MPVEYQWNKTRYPFAHISSVGNACLLGLGVNRCPYMPLAAFQLTEMGFCQYHEVENI